MIRELRADLARYREVEGSWKSVVSNPAAWCVVCYRFGRWAYREDPPKLLQPLAKAAHKVTSSMLGVVMEMYIDPQAQIGEGLYVGHIGGVHIDQDAVIGKNCDIAHQVTIGTSAGGRSGAPSIGDGVYIGTGAKVIGKIKIGDGAKIAANSLVVSNVPDEATAIGVPAKVMRAPKPKNTGEQR
jgi:serine O-acetyltransferase